MIAIRHLSMRLTAGGRRVTILDDVALSIPPKQMVAVMGPSGSGKTTLLGLAAGLDRPSSGSIELNGVQLDQLDEDQRAKVRNQHVGFIFQNFQLLPTLTALENIMVPLELRGEKKIKPKAMDLLEKVGLAERGHHYPTQLSGGEQQRISLARAFSNEPRILFADEPTGNLDDETSHRIVDLIFNLNKQSGTTLIMVTHNLELANMTDRIIRLKGGKLVQS